jgi:ATP-binding cassette subfamily B protein
MKSASASYRRIANFILPYWRKLALVLALSLISTVLGLAQPYITKLLIDEALLRRNIRALISVAILMVVVTVLGFALNILSSYRYVSTSAAVLFDMRLAVYRHLQRMSPTYYARTRLGEIVSRLNNDVGEVQRVAADTLLSAVGNVIFLAGSIVIMLLLNWKLFLLSIILVPVSVMMLKRYRARLADRVQQMRERSADIGSFLIETLMGMRLVVSSNAEAREAARFEKRNRSFVSALLSMQLTSYMAGALPGTILTLSTALVFLYGGKLVIDGAMTIGALVAFMAYHMRLLTPVQNLMGLYTSVTTARVSLNRVFEILDAPVEVVEAPGAKELPRVSGELEFDNVSLKYDREMPVLDRVSFRIPAGSICAIAGPSGVGKSTVADLVLRFYDPQEGTVMLDGHDLRDVRLEDLRKHIGLVEQSPFLFNASVAENIKYGRPEASREQIVRAARGASVHDFIQSLPQGYDTEVGERGQTLSAGERQRIALARVLLRDPAVIILDEPSASLDPLTESRIAASLSVRAQSAEMRGQRSEPGQRRLGARAERSEAGGWSLDGGSFEGPVAVGPEGIARTTVIISHRRSLIEMADLVIVIEGGKVVECGPPMQLLASGSALASLFGSG